MEHAEYRLDPVHDEAESFIRTIYHLTLSELGPAPALLGGIASSGAHAAVQLEPLAFGTFQSPSPVDIAALILRR
jgi:hypothetical protein